MVRARPARTRDVGIRIIGRLGIRVSFFGTIKGKVRVLARVERDGREAQAETMDGG
jgi:hypothetical protein